MADNGVDYRRAALSDLETNPEKPGRRWEVSPELGMTDYNYNVAELDPGTRLSQNAYHYHEDQREFYHVLAGRCRVEVDEGAFVMGPDEFCRFDAGAPHLLHNPYDEVCRIVAVGAPPEGRHPCHQVQSYEELVEERYDGDVPTGE